MFPTLWRIITDDGKASVDKKSRVMKKPVNFVKNKTTKPANFARNGAKKPVKKIAKNGAKNKREYNPAIGVMYTETEGKDLVSSVRFVNGS